MKIDMSREQLAHLYESVRNNTEKLCRPLEIEDYVVQSIEDVSPPKWHLAHTTWFFETFILVPHLKNYQIFHPLFHHLFNSYYQTLGAPYPRVRRGILSRPTVNNIYAYRRYVDQSVLDYISQLTNEELRIITPLIILGLNHEQQHQELLLMDIKHNFFQDPDFPCYRFSHQQPSNAQVLAFNYVSGGVVAIGHQGADFCFDNELPRHAQILNPYLMATRLVTNGEYCEFIEAGGYRQPMWWLADGWECVVKNDWQAPLYWQNINGEWTIFTLNGLRKLDLTEPVSHVSFYEADAYARFRGLRLPSEAEWEFYVASMNLSQEAGHFMEANYFHPQAAKNDNPQQLLGDLWEWTLSPYCAYPGYKQTTGALGEYNGKFMSNQIVLRGGSCITPQSHIRASYRNFFQPDKRWQFSGIRLASDEKERI